METMESMYAARYNVYWYMSFLIPAVIMLVGTFWKKKSILVFAVVMSLLTTYSLCNLSVQKKWQDRFNLAQTTEQREYAHADGANLVFTALIIGPFEAILYTSFWGFIGWVSWPKLKSNEFPEQT